MNKDYVLTKGAVADLKEITRYTQSEWGTAQCKTYMDQLEDAAIAVARGDGVFKTMDALHPGLRMARCGRHYIFCLPRPHALPVILAILHERMDILARLKNRLG